MNKLLSLSLLAAAAIGGSAVALTGAPAPLAATVADDVASMIPASVGDSEVKFVLNEEKNGGMVTVTFTAPTEYEENWTRYPLPDGVELEIIINRTDSKWITETIHTESGVAPGTTMTYEDTDIVLGEQYQYNVIAKLGENESSSYGGYGRVFAGVEPAQPEISATSGDKGTAPITVNVNLVNKDVAGDDMIVPITKLRLERKELNQETYDQTIATVIEWEAPVEGETYTYVDNDVKEGFLYNYYAYSECDLGTSEGSYSKTLMIGLDKPAAPTPVVAGFGDDGVVISWAPAEGENGGYVDPAEVEYVVARYYAYDNIQTIGVVKGETSFVDNLEGIDAQIELGWCVQARNAQGESYQTSAVSNTIVVGPASKLPYTETFSTSGQWSLTSDNLWTYKIISGYGMWGVTSYSSYKDAAGDYVQINGIGYPEADSYAGANFFDGADSKTTYTSGAISLEGTSNPIVSFYYFGIPGSRVIISLEVVGHYGEPGIMPLDEEQPEEEYYTVWSECIGEVTEAGWKRVNAHLNGFLGDVQLRFVGECAASGEGDATSACIDNISLIDYPMPADLTAVANSDQSVTLTWAGTSAGGSGNEPVVPDEPVVEGDGTAEHPYTVMQIKNETAAGENVWAEGYVVGYIVGGNWSEGSMHFTAEDAVATNILLSNVPVEEANIDNTIPVQLPKNVRDQLSLASAPEMLGQKVRLLGNVEKYFGIMAFKNVTEFEVQDYSVALAAEEEEDASAVAPREYVVSRGGVVIANTTETTFTTEPLEVGYYTFGVMAIYEVEGEEIETPEAYAEVNVIETGVEKVEIADVVDVKYFNLQGVAINTPARGEVVVRQATLSNGKTVTEKVVVRK